MGSVVAKKKFFVYKLTFWNVVFILKAMGLEVIRKNEWVYVPAPGRLDAFNFELTKKELERVASESKQIALDVSSAHFVSIPMIKFIHSLANEMLRRGGCFALVGSSEKLKRQIHIFASLDPLVIYTQDDWNQLVNTGVEGHA